MKKNWRKIFIGLCMAAVTAVCAMPVAVRAATVNVALGTTDNARSGDMVTARIVLSDNPGLSTFAMKLAYDDTYLTYMGATWANSITSNNNNVQLISEVTENNKPALNISSILGTVYSNNETIVTLNFTVKQDYDTMPVTLTNRAITESSAGFPEATVNIVVDAKAGITQQPENTETQSQSQDNNNSQTNSENNTQSNSQGNSQNNNTNTGNNTNNNTNTNNNSGNQNNNHSGNKLDKTPKTGAMDIRYVLGGAVVVFLVIAGISIKVLRKKRS